MPEKIKYGKEIWRTDPDAAFEEARRRCLWASERAEETWLFLSDLLALERLPQELAALHHITRLDIGDARGPDSNLHHHSILRPLSAWGPLSALPSLQRLSLVFTNISSLDVLPNVAGLIELDLRRTPVIDISALTSAARLQRLNLASTPVSDIRSLSGAARLQRLDLRSTKVSDISALSGAAELQMLDLSGSPVSDISALSGVTALKSLGLNHTKVSDISALLEIPTFSADRSFQLKFYETPLTKRDGGWSEIARLADHGERVRRAVAELRAENAKKSADAAKDMCRAAEAQSGAEILLLPDGRASLSQAPAGAAYPYQSDAAQAREIEAQAENIKVAISTLELLTSNTAQEIFAPRLTAYLSALSEDTPDILRIRPRWQVLGPAIADDFHRQSLDDGVVALLDEIARQHEAVAKAVEKDDAPTLKVHETGPDPDEDGAAIQPLAEEAAEILSSDKASEAIDDTFAATIVANLEAMNQTLQTRALETERQKAERTRRFRAAAKMITATVAFAGSLAGLSGYNAGEAAIYLADKMAPIWQALQRFFI